MGERGWALILGASSGFGAAAARAFARSGLDVCGVHLDRKSTVANAEAVRKDVEAAGSRALFVNANAADGEQRARIVEALREAAGGGPRVRVLLHSLAFGTLRPLVSATAKEAVSPAQMAMTLDVMATSLVDWTQALVAADLWESGARIFAMTSEGSKRVMAAYGPVAAAKAALEALVRQLAVELAPREIAVNAICAGVTETPAVRAIPGSAAMIERSRARHPRGRLTTPEDVAGVLVALSDPACGWCTGNVIQVDGGEGLVP
ncbi:MAG TPA: SDR family oxidoreductase [Myxococcota bacterium]|jgi:NAD(P)-dependent dehydrogenase (short-subunit alcohol dehydrogenase family)|nr:SDR family oxidoreductase [Myxococcota bacterium]